MSGKYDDIINLPHHEPTTRPRMPLAERAAQFSPFAALTGYEAVVQEAGRLTDTRAEPDEYELAALDERLGALEARLPERPKAAVTYFVPDAKKAGGKYVTAAGAVVKIDRAKSTLRMEDGREIPLDAVVGIECEGAKG